MAENSIHTNQSMNDEDRALMKLLRWVNRRGENGLDGRKVEDKYMREAIVALERGLVILSPIGDYYLSDAGREWLGI